MILWVMTDKPSAVDVQELTTYCLSLEIISRKVINYLLVADRFEVFSNDTNVEVKMDVQFISIITVFLS